MDEMSAVTDLIEPSDAPAVVATADQLVPALYEDLRRLARRERANGGGWGNHTLQTTALIHEAYLKMRDAPGFNDRNHFLRASALAMRHILVDGARERLAAKRGGGANVQAGKQRDDDGPAELSPNADQPRSRSRPPYWCG